MKRNKKKFQVIGKLTKEEKIKKRSNYLRGTIVKDLNNTITNGFLGDNYSLIRFHGMYQQDDRDIRRERIEQKLEPKYSMMLRCRLPGGVITSKQWLKIHFFSEKYTIYGNIRLTNRQTFQLHGIFKKDLKLLHNILNNIGLDSIATANDVNRNVLCTSNPDISKLHQQVYKIAVKLSEHLLPKTRAYAEVWLDQKKILSSDNEPILGNTYLPRKFKTAIMIPPENDVDINANDMVFIAIKNNNNDLVGFNLLLGGGLSIEHGNNLTWPSCAIEFGYFDIKNILSIAESVVSIQRDWGNRTNRKNAKLRYTIARVGFKIFKKEIEKRSGVLFKKIKKYKITKRGDFLGWKKGINNKWNFTLFVPNGRILNKKNNKIKTALYKISLIHKGFFRLTANQNLIICDIDSKVKKKIENIIDIYNLNKNNSMLKQNSMACVSFPTCPLAMAESERVLKKYIKKIENILLKYNLFEENIVFRISGCPNGCGRSLLSEIGLIGKSFGKYNLYIGGDVIGTRLAKIYRENIDEKEIFNNIDNLIFIWSKNKFKNESFGDFVNRFNLN
ncbi:assimilatory sulfite reductase (NADPH) hemoprotein subunit [Buchnera aphidicola]|uniref:assimilatory sulfite reductase (NADPH) hemoprotein subunit n=1 Tax=Buchnera aphidicola TaxID=9 RepID=UPI0031B80394